MNSKNKIRKYKVDAEAVCSDCIPEQGYRQMKVTDETVDVWAKRHVKETGHIVSIHELHDVAPFEETT